MNAKHKYICLTMVAISAFSTVACGNANTATEPDAAVYAAAEPATVSGNADTPDIQEPQNTSEKDTTQVRIANRYPDADFIEMIAENRYIILNDDQDEHNTYIRVFDSEKNTIISNITVDNQNTYRVRPYIIKDKGFGIVTENTTAASNVKAYFYDTDGNLINTFFKILANHEVCKSSYAFAPDGSEFYVTSTNRDQCVCGYDLKDDYTTQVYIVHNTTDYELLSEFDSHTDVHLYGTTADGKLIFSFHYDPFERDPNKTHDAFENNPGDPYMQFREENGFGFMDPTGYEIDTPELAPLYDSDIYYDQVYIRGNSIILANNERIVRLDPDNNGEYLEQVYSIPGGLTGLNDDIYLSYDGDYVVYPIYKNSYGDTEVHILKYEGNSYSEIFEQEYEKQIKFEPEFWISYVDVSDGILYGRINNIIIKEYNRKNDDKMLFSVNFLEE